MVVENHYYTTDPDYTNSVIRIFPNIKVIVVQVVTLHDAGKGS